jgi:Spy/CpxP family protein refolding chaperone
MQGLAARLMVCSIVLAFVILPEVTAAPGKDRQADAPKAGGPERVPTAGEGQGGKTPWWQESRTQEALELTEEQRAKMDEILANYQTNRPEDRRATAFHETLVQGTWKEARAEVEKLAKVAETSVRLRGEFKVDVLSLLSKEQHQKLIDRFPRLIYRPWARVMRGDPLR